MASQFEICALNAYNQLSASKNPNNISPEVVWKTTLRNMGASRDTVKKCCPKLAFEGLVENNLLKNLPNFKATHKNCKNITYALILVSLYKNGTILNHKTKKARWGFFVQEAIKRGMQNVAKKNNGQLDVVESLFNNNLIK